MPDPKRSAIRAHAIGVTVLAAFSIAMQLRLNGWIVEDAAISFSYARNLADGFGLVPFPGAERVEGYANPLWVALLAALHLVGVDGFTAARWSAPIFTLFTAALVWAIARRTRPGLDLAPLAAAACLCTNGVYAIWASSGLENGLLCAEIALAMWLSARERDRDGGFPWSSAAWLAVALTRPEGAVYAGFGVLWGAIGSGARTARIRAAVVRISVFLAPLAIYHAARYTYFALPFPAPFYAELGGLDALAAGSHSRGWGDLGGWSVEVGAAFFLPLLALPILSAAAGRCPRLRAALPALSAVPQRADVAGLALGLCACVAAFTVAADGDRVEGYRFLSFLAVPFAVLFGMGIGALGDAISASTPWRRRASAASLVACAAWAFPNVWLVAAYDCPASPFDIKRRLDDYVRLSEALDLERPFVAVDHDMGAMTYWLGPETGTVVDARGLTDLPFALHGRRQRFVREYLFEERPFDFCHAHASTRAALKALPEFRRAYVPAPPYPTPDGPHDGTFVRKDLIVAPRWDGPRSGARLGQGLVLEGAAVGSAEVAAGAELRVRVGLRASRRPIRDLEITVFAERDGRRIAETTFVPGLGGAYPSRRWKAHEVVVDRASLTLPARLADGPLDIGVSANVGGRKLLRGAARAVSEGAAERLAARDLAALADRAGVLECEGAESSWRKAAERRRGVPAWRAAHRPDASRTIAACWARVATTSSDDGERVRALEHARSWDAASQDARAAGGDLAELLLAKADAALASGDRNLAYAFYRDAVRADPSRASARRRAEELRPTRPRDQRRELPADDLDRLAALGYVAGSQPASAKTGVTIHDPARAQPGLNFYTSGHASEAILADMSGATVHVWRCPFDAVWPGRAPVAQSGFLRRAEPLPNGHILAIWDGLGLAEIDADSDLVWKLDEPVHHDVSVTVDGRIFALVREQPSGPHDAKVPFEEFILELSPGGSVVRRVSLIKAFERAAPALRALWTQRTQDAPDALHSNSIQILSADEAAAIPGAGAGDALVSLRNLDTVAVVNLASQAIVWATKGAFARQHEATIVPGGRLLLFDNLGFERFSAVREYEPRGMREIWRYAGLPGRRFFTRTCGAAHRLRNGDTLIVESDPGRAFEVTPGGETVWEFYSPHRAGDRGALVATLFDVARLPLGYAASFAAKP